MQAMPQLNLASVACFSFSLCLCSLTSRVILLKKYIVIYVTWMLYIVFLFDNLDFVWLVTCRVWQKSRQTLDMPEHGSGEHK